MHMSMHTPAMQPTTLASFPEELLERILSYSVVARTANTPRPAWHRPSSRAPVRGRLALLLVSKRFLRICTPLFYHTLHIGSPAQLHYLLRHALRPNAVLASYIRKVVLAGVWADAGELFQLCHKRLESLEVTLDAMMLPPGGTGTVRDLDAEEFCEGLGALTRLKHIAIRKPGSVYLTQARPRYVLFAVAQAMYAWNKLEYAELAFRVSDDAGGRAPGPIAALTAALGTRPRLHTLVTLLPSVWNECLLRVSVNPALERIVLGDGMHDAPTAAMDIAPGIQSTGLFFLQAKKHVRLCELIRAGTSITRTRAQTMGTHTPPMSVLHSGHHPRAYNQDTSFASNNSRSSKSERREERGSHPWERREAPL